MGGFTDLGIKNLKPKDKAYFKAERGRGEAKEPASISKCTLQGLRPGGLGINWTAAHDGIVSEAILSCPCPRSGRNSPEQPPV